MDKSILLQSQVKMSVSETDCWSGLKVLRGDVSAFFE